MYNSLLISVIYRLKKSKKKHTQPVLLKRFYGICMLIMRIDFLQNFSYIPPANRPYNNTHVTDAHLIANRLIRYYYANY